nr:IS1182 family transposase [Desulfuromonadales bacterium]
MMGRLAGDQDRLFYEFHLDAVVPGDHLVRRIDRVLDLSWLRAELRPYYSHTGRPSVDPELMIRMLIVGYVFAIRSERQLCSEVQVNLAYRWFCGLGLEDRVPDHSAFSRVRHERFRAADLLRRVFERVVGRCLAAGLVGGHGFSVDASLIKADVNASKRVAGEQVDELPDRAAASRAVVEYFDVLDEEKAAGSQGPAAAGKQKAPPKALSLTDPLAAWVARRRMRPIFAYDANYLIDNELGIILDAEATRANRIEENQAAVRMVARVEERFGLSPERLAADTAYGTGRTLKSLVERGIEPHIPVWDKSKETKGKFTKADFTYDRERDRYICPGGKALTATGKVDQGRILPYRASIRDCGSCSLKPRCTSAPARKVSRDIDEDVRDQVRALADTQAFETSRRERKKVEMAFAHMKRILKLDRLRLRGLSGARDEILLAATAQNLRKLVKYAGPAPPLDPKPA